jgi:hypothetical protein
MGERPNERMKLTRPAMPSQMRLLPLILTVVRTHGVPKLSTGVGLAVFVSSLLGQVAAVEPDNAVRIERVVEATIRHLATEYCASDPCYLSVNKKRPSESLIQRLTPSPHLVPVPADGFTEERTPEASWFLVDVGPVQILPDGRAQVGSSVGGVGGPIFMLCAYFLRDVEGTWTVMEDDTSCAVL